VRNETTTTKILFETYLPSTLIQIKFVRGTASRSSSYSTRNVLIFEFADLGVISFISVLPASLIGLLPAQSLLPAQNNLYLSTDDPQRLVFDTGALAPSAQHIDRGTHFHFKILRWDRGTFDLY